MARKWLLLMICCWMYSRAQSNEWPVVFSVPEKTDTTADTLRIKVSTDSKVFKNDEKASNALLWKPGVPPLWNMQQRCLFETSGNADLDATNQFYDLSGSVVRDSILPANGSLGLEWTPTSYLNLRQSGGGFQTTNDFGPMMQWRPGDIPVGVKGGISGAGWNDSLPVHLSRSRVDDFHGDAGYYGAFSFGDPSKRFLGKPLYLNAQAFGRSIMQAGIAGITGSALYNGAFNDGDSLFAYYGDSLSDGKENYWGSGTVGQPHYMSTPWRIARGLQAAGGVMTKERFGFRPSMVYSYSRNSVAYPSVESARNDVRVSMQSLQLLVHSHDGFPVVYKGGIKFAWGQEEWLFNKGLSSNASPYDNAQLLGLEVKRIGDHQKYIATSDHYVGIALPRDFLAEYKLSLLRDSKTYDFHYPFGGIEKRNFGDNDRITINHHLGISRQRTNRLGAELYGDYSEYIINYLFKENSAKNATENGYRIGLNSTYAPCSPVLFSENVSCDAEITDYRYIVAHRGDSTLTNFDPPPAQRMFSSLFTGLWKIGNNWEVDGKWIERYCDRGKWYGREYLSVDTLRSNYYAVDTKTLEYSVEFAIALMLPQLRVKGGGMFRDNNDLTFNNIKRDYEQAEGGISYFMEPFVEVQSNFRHFSLKGRVARMFNKLTSGQWEPGRNWDLHLVGSAQW